MLSDYQLKISFDYNISIDTAINLVLNFFYKEKYELHYKTCNIIEDYD